MRPRREGAPGSEIAGDSHSQTPTYRGSSLGDCGQQQGVVPVTLLSALGAVRPVAPVSVKWPVVAVCISQVMNEAEHCIIGILAISFLLCELVAYLYPFSVGCVL